MNLSYRFFLLLNTALWFGGLAQNPPYINIPSTQFPQPSSLGSDTYIRAAIQLNLPAPSGTTTGFHYAAGTNLLNLGISSYPSYVNNNYINPASNPNYYSFNPSLEAGVTPASHQVDNIGGFNYNVPMVCSPGTAGIEPKLSIVYNSNGGNSWLGLGFNISGISAITRTGKTALYDGLNGGIKLTSSDVFALDGSRLFLKTGTGYGQSGATYRTEVENFYSITSSGTQGNGPQYFTVTTPDGMTMEYGSVASAKSVDVGNTEVLAWYINKVHDVYGNYMTYSYTNTNGELLIDKIEYTGNGSTAPYNKVEFNYIERSDNASLYVAGKEFRNKHLITNIACKDINGHAVRKYFFEYQYQRRSLLSKITEVDAAGNQLNPTFFEWNDETPSWNWNFGSITTATDIISTTPANLDLDGHQDLVLTRRINGELRLDIKQNVSPYGANAFLTPWYITNTFLLSNDPTIEVFSACAFDEDDDGIQEIFYTLGHPSTNSPSYDWQIKKLKVTGPNQFSVLQEEPLHSVTGFPMHHLSGVIWNYQKNPTTGFFYGKQDITGDNLNDVIMSDESSIIIKPSNQQPTIILPISNLVKMSLGDFNGDGVADIYVSTIASSTINCQNFSVNNIITEIFVYSYNNTTNSLDLVTSIALNTGISPFMSTWPTPCINFAYMNVDKCTGFGDVDGDGKTDVFCVNYNNGTNYCSLNWFRSNGNLFMNGPMDVISLNVPTEANGFEANFYPSDANNDGKADVMVARFDNVIIGYGYYSYYTSIGNALVNESIPPVTIKGTRLSAMGDFNGDGDMEFVFQDINSGFIRYRCFDEDQKKMVKRIFNIKNEITIKYDFLSGSLTDAYKKSSFIYNGSNLNFKIIVPRLHVVSTIISNGQNTSYGYENALLHREGKGLLGFERIFNRLNDMPESNTPERSGVYSGYLYNAVHDGVDWSENVSANLSSNNIFYFNGPSAYSSTQLSYNYLNNSSFLRSLSNSESISKNFLNSTNNRQSAQYDPNNGMVLTSVIQHLTWQNQPIKISQTTTVYQSFINPVNNSLYYKPQQITEQLTAGGASSSFVHVNSYDYLGRLQFTIKNFNTQQPVTTYYSAFTAFGLPQSLMISAQDIQPRSTQLQYDVTGRFITKITDPIGQIEENIYEPGLGNKIQNKDLSGLITNYKYDGLGRTVEIKFPTGAVNSVQYEWSAYSDPAISDSPYNGTGYGVKVVAQVAGGPTTVKYNDRNGNLLKLERGGFNGASEEANYTYNSLNQLLTAQSLHYASQSNYNTISYAYDYYLRPLSISNSLGNTVSYEYNSLSNPIYIKGFVKVSTAGPVANSTYYVKRDNNEAGQVDKVTNYSNPQQLQTATYQFNEFGQPSTVSNDFAGTGQYNITMGYDVLGRQISLNDPNAGNYTYNYNSIGQLLHQNTPNGSYNMQYDALGRVTQKSDGAGNTYTYDYETQADGRGQLKKITGVNALTEFKYDALSRMIEEKETVIADNKELKSSFTYNTYGQVLNHTYPGGFVSTNEYDQIGNLVKIKKDNTVIWQLGSMIAPGKVNNYKYNNSLLNNDVTYDANLNVSSSTYGSLMTEFYQIAPNTGNLMEREFITGNSVNQDIFTYDEFDRLKQVDYYDNSYTQQTRATSSYYNNGNFNNKSDCGNYVYGNSGAPYQLTQINNPVANNINPNTLNLSYTSFGKVSQISQAANAGSKQYNFVYGNDQERIKMTYQNAGQLQYTRYYAGNYDLEVDANGQSREWSYIYAPTGLCAIYYKTSSVGGQLLYAATDHLGSPLMLTDASGAIVEEYSFDAWGRKRNPHDWNDYTVTPSAYMIRGYTMHEMLDELGLVNMNGRIYEPVLGRFLQPDNYVQAPDNLQNFNRYAYCWNNPMKYTDPTGNFTWGDLVSSVMIVAGVVLVATGVGAGVGTALIVGGATHFAVTTQNAINNGQSWNQASNSAGVSVSVNFTPNWGNNNPTPINESNYQNLAPVNQPVISPPLYANVNGDYASVIDPGLNAGRIENLNGVKGLTLLQYDSFSPDMLRIDDDKGTGGGAIFQVSYTSDKINSTARWSQRIYTNYPTESSSGVDKISPYWDNDDGSIYYAGPQNTAGNTSTMFDVSSRGEDRGNVNWMGVAMLMQDNKPVVRIVWGFSTVNGQTTKRPISVMGN